MVAGTVLAGVGMVLFVIQQSLTIPLQARLRFGWVAALQLLFLVGLAVEAVVLVAIGAGLLPFFALWIPITILVLAITVGSAGRTRVCCPRSIRRNGGECCARSCRSRPRSYSRSCTSALRR